MTAETEPFILQLEQTDSTNTYVREHFDMLPDLALVTAVYQSAGRGRLGRKWIAPPGLNFCGTFCFKNVHDGFHAGMICGVALMDTMKEIAPEVDCYLKWPNDLYLGKAKLAGMLGEGIIRNGKLAGIAMGTGLNVNTTAEDLAGVGQPAVSLKTACQRDFNLENLTKSLAISLKRCYINYSNSIDAVFARWRAANRLLGRQIGLTDSCGKRWEGSFCDVTGSGELVLEFLSPEGKRMRKNFNCGDVSVEKSTI